jgi:hypothetical protein
VDASDPGCSEAVRVGFSELIRESPHIHERPVVVNLDRTRRIGLHDTVGCGEDLARSHQRTAALV